MAKRTSKYDLDSGFDEAPVSGRDRLINAVSVYSSDVDEVGFRPDVCVKVTKDIADDWAWKLEGLYSGGESMVEVCRAMKITKSQYMEAINVSEQFKRADEYGHVVSEAWWAETGRKGASGEARVNANTWAMNMKNRYEWSDREAKVDAPQNENKPTHLTVVFRSPEISRDISRNSERVITSVEAPVIIDGDFEDA